MKPQIPQEEMTMKIKQILALGLLSTLLPYAQEPIQDSDFDGVSDSQDLCPNTPFLCEVNAQGCTVNILTLPNESEKDSFIASVGYGYATNEDLKSREKQHNSNIQLSYYKKQWSYMLHTGYYTHSEHDGILDTTFKIRKRIHLAKQWVLGLGGGITLPTHEYTGNRTDIFLSGTLHYYATDTLSTFAGYSFTRNGDKVDPKVRNDDDEIQELSNYHKAYVGLGYFFNPNFYANLSYHLEQSKFRGEHNRQAFSSTLYYKIDEKWFATFSYKREFADEDLHDNLLFKVGYHIW